MGDRHGNDVPQSEDTETVTFLTENGASLNFQEDRGRTALMFAAEQGHSQAASVLIEAGVDLTLVDKKGRTAFDLAANATVRDMLNAASDLFESFRGQRMNYLNNAFTWNGPSCGFGISLDHLSFKTGDVCTCGKPHPAALHLLVSLI